MHQHSTTMEPLLPPEPPFSLLCGEYTRKQTVGDQKERLSTSLVPRPLLSLPLIEQPKPTDFKKRKRGRPPLEKDSRLCTNCGTSETPEWRKGPLGPHTLCNACGLQWMKAQKREHEIKTKYEEARKKNSLMRVLNSSHGGIASTNINTIHLSPDPSSPPYATSPHGMDGSEHSGELNSRYNSDIDTLPLDPSISPTISPMQIMPTPVTLDTLNTLKAMQTISALSHMNHLNHINTLNILSALNSEGPLAPSFSPSFSPSPPSMGYYSSHYPADPSPRLPHISPQQLFFPMAPYGVLNPMNNNPNPLNSYLQTIPMKDNFAHCSDELVTHNGVTSGGGQM